MKELTAIEARKLIGKKDTMHVQINDGPGNGSEPSVTIFKSNDIAVTIKWDMEREYFRYFQDKVYHPNPNGNPYNDGKVGFIG